MLSLAQLMVVAVVSFAHIAPLGGSAHYFLLRTFGVVPEITGATSLAIYLGILAAMIACFRVELWDMGVGMVRAAKGKRDPGARLAAQIFAATLPVAALVFALPFLAFSPPAATPALLGWSAVVGGVLLLLLDRMSMTIKRLEHASYLDMIVVALAQIIAFLVPGVGRSSITMTFARALGYERADAARLSMLLGLPALAGWCLLHGIDLARAGALVWESRLLAVGAASFCVGLATLAVMLAWLKRRSFAPFGIYRLLVGAAILLIVWQGTG